MKQFSNIAISGIIATVTSQVIKIGLQLSAMFILARMLVPEDFGLVATVAPLLAFIVLFQDIGLQQSVVQRKEITSAQLNRIFWTMMLLSIICASIIIVLSPAVAWFYKDQRLISLSIISTIPLLLNSMGALPLSIMTRNFKFKKIAYIVSASNVIGFAVAVLGAYQGIGYWALLAMPIVVAFVTTLGGFFVSEWRPGKPQIGLEKDILHFGMNFTGFNVVNFFSRNLDNILIAKYEGSAQLGFYDFAYKLLLLPLRSINDPIARVIIPILSRIQDDSERFRLIYLRVIGAMSLVVVPGVVAVTIVADQIVPILFGDKWGPIVPVFSWLGMASMVQVIGSSTGWIFISLGKTKEMLYLGVFSSVLTIIAFLVGLKWGIVGVAACYTIVTYLKFPISYYYTGRIGPITAKDLLIIQSSFLIAGAMTWGVDEFILRSVVGAEKWALFFLTGVTSYAFAFFFFWMTSLGRFVILENYGMLNKYVYTKQK